ncbi:hypothetical protein C900_04411 [Fulvivirga imtechensis AK7]|uniref:GNAT family N-acetyltransferase n=1 Tax=Fulvivirga imtechensis AK7 TaxID=1237149 RepID=L8JM84_9BACT|nr:hypothetical protein [Fulvivirga imtechensis]ELR70041.1 hypothetical protein C900_04411 [Fulvivirga imtechensis AK7]
MNDVTIIDYAPEYSRYFKSLNVEWLEQYFTVEPIDLPILDQPFEKIIAPGEDVIFALWQGRVVGTCA